MEHRGVNEDSSTVSSHSQAHNSSLSQDNQNKSSFFFCFFFCIALTMCQAGI